MSQRSHVTVDRGEAEVDKLYYFSILGLREVVSSGRGADRKCYILSEDKKMYMYCDTLYCRGGSAKNVT